MKSSTILLVLALGLFLAVSYVRSEDEAVVAENTIELPKLNVSSIVEGPTSEAAEKSSVKHNPKHKAHPHHAVHHKAHGHKAHPHKAHGHKAHPHKAHAHKAHPHKAVNSTKKQ